MNKKEKKRVTIDIIKKITRGVLSTLVDVIVLQSVVWYEFLSNPKARTMKGLNYAVAKRLDLLDGVEGVIDEKSYKQALKRARRKGWIDKDFYPTKEGRKRLESTLNICFEKPKKWDRKWYIVVFDIPEHKRQIRNVLRNKLKALGFGMLQASVWISPYPYLGDVEEIVKSYNLERYVLYAVSKKVGRYNSKELADQVWRLDKINKQYQEFLGKYEELESKSAIKDLNKLKFDYLSVLQADPRLPAELLPDNWTGERAYRIYRNLLRSITSSIIRS